MQLGSFLREHYLSPGAPSYIPGVQSDVIDDRQLLIRADNGGEGGAIVAVSSVAARLGSPVTYVHYAAAKAGVEALVVGLAREVAADGSTSATQGVGYAQETYWFTTCLTAQRTLDLTVSGCLLTKP